jgi:hypothetical protein
MIQYRLTLRGMWFSMASLISQIQTFTCSSPSPLVPQDQASWLLFSIAWFITTKPLLILLQPTIMSLTHLFMSSMKKLLHLFFMLYIIVDTNDCVFMSWMYSKVVIDMKCRWLIFFSSYSWQPCQLWYIFGWWCFHILIKGLDMVLLY